MTMRPQGEIYGCHRRLGFDRHTSLAKRSHMRGAVGGRAGLQPTGEAGQEIIVIEIVAPKGRVFNAGLSQRTIEVEHTHQTRPLTAPVGHGKDRAAMRHQSG